MQKSFNLRNSRIDTLSTSYADVPLYMFRHLLLLGKYIVKSVKIGERINRRVAVVEWLRKAKTVDMA